LLEDRLLILGCDPFAHYRGLDEPSPSEEYANRPDTGSPRTAPILRPVE
jgi:hypothetical protein